LSQVEPATSDKRRMLSPKYRAWLLFWSLVRLVIVLPIWLFGIVALIVGVALSPWGTGVLLSQGEQRDFFSYAHHEGGLLDHFQLENFQLQLGETRITVDEFELQWADDCVLSGRLCIDTLRVVGADIQLGPSNEQAPPPEEEGSPLAIRFPFPIELRSLLLDDVNLSLRMVPK